MGRSACCSKVGLRRGPWSAKEDSILASYIQLHGEGQWRSLPLKAGLLRCGKSCRLRWMNYLRPGIKRGNISQDEEDLIVRLHRLLGNRWSLIAGRLPGRTDNEIKNYWNTHLLKKLHSAAAAAPTPAPAPRNKAKKAAAAAKLTSSEAKMEGEDVQKHTTKVYSPKPMRVSSTFTRTASCDSLVSGSSSSEGAAEVVVSAWPPLHDLVEDPAALYHFSDSVPGDASMWEEVFAEYLNLL